MFSDCILNRCTLGQRQFSSFIYHVLFGFSYILRLSLWNEYPVFTLFHWVFKYCIYGEKIAPVQHSFFSLGDKQTVNLFELFIDTDNFYRKLIKCIFKAYQILLAWKMALKSLWVFFTENNKCGQLDLFSVRVGSQPGKKSYQNIFRNFSFQSCTKTFQYCTSLLSISKT